MPGLGGPYNVDIFIGKLPPKFKKMSYVLASMIGVFLLGCLTYASFKLLSDSIQFHSVTPDLKFPHWVMNLAMVLGSGYLPYNALFQFYLLSGSSINLICINSQRRTLWILPMGC
jgi:TRAP-type C4-dicarboxylate transport system permease small subunit